MFVLTPPKVYEHVIFTSSLLSLAPRMSDSVSSLGDYTLNPDDSAATQVTAIAKTAAFVPRTVAWNTVKD